MSVRRFKEASSNQHQALLLEALIPVQNELQLEQ